MYALLHQLTFQIKAYYCTKHLPKVLYCTYSPKLYSAEFVADFCMQHRQGAELNWGVWKMKIPPC